MTNKERYQRLCDTEPGICVYDQPWWMDAVCGAENWDVVLYEKKGNLVGALPYYCRKRYRQTPAPGQRNTGAGSNDASALSGKRNKQIINFIFERMNP